MDRYLLRQRGMAVSPPEPSVRIPSRGETAPYLPFMPVAPLYQVQEFHSSLGVVPEGAEHGAHHGDPVATAGFALGADQRISGHGDRPSRPPTFRGGCGP